MTPAVRPRFRTDLVAEPIQEDGKHFIDVFDPDSGTGFRFYEIEYSLACAMDGERDVAGLVSWAKEELGVEPSARELTTVISTLGELGYLAGERPADLVGDLVQGVVSARPTAPPPTEAFELGTAGGTAAELGRELPAADVELGLAGGVAVPRPVVDDFGTGPELGPAGRDDFPAPPPTAMPAAVLRPTSIPDADTDGPTDLPRPVPLAGIDEEISTDLSDHLAISASDVKDAVRASRVMHAVDLPADLAATLAAAEAEQEARAAADKATATAAAERAAADKAAAEQAERAAAEQAAAARAAQAVVRPIEPGPAVEKAAEKPTDKVADKAATKPADKVADKAATKPTDKAATKPADKAATKPVDKAATKLADKAATKAAVEPPAEPRTSRFLIFLLVLTILLAGTYLVWTQLLKKPLPWEKAPPTETATAPTRRTPPPPPPAPPPPPPTSMLKATATAPVDVAAGRQGVVAAVVADGSTVVAGDVLVRFWASKALTKQHDASQKRLEVDLPKVIADLTAKRDAAQAAGKTEAVKTWQDKLDKQLVTKTSLEAEVTSLTTQLDAYTVKAQLGGTVAVKVAKNAKITKIEQVIASITAPTKLVAEFTPNAGKVYSVAQSVRVTVKATPTQTANCTVTAVEGTTVTIECPSDAGLVGDTEITLE